MTFDPHEMIIFQFNSTSVSKLNFWARKPGGGKRSYLSSLLENKRRISQTVFFSPFFSTFELMSMRDQSYWLAMYKLPHPNLSVHFSPDLNSPYILALGLSDRETDSNSDLSGSLWNVPAWTSMIFYLISVPFTW